MKAARSAESPPAERNGSPVSAEDAFAAWRRGERLRTVEAMVSTLKGRYGTATDISHLADVASFDAHRTHAQQPAAVDRDPRLPDISLGSDNVEEVLRLQPPPPSMHSWSSSSSGRARLLRLRARVIDDYEALLEKYRVVGPSPIPTSVLEHLRREGSSHLAPTAIARDTVAGVQFGTMSPSIRVPPSRADAVAVAQAMTVMHRWVDRSYDEAARGERRAGVPALPAAERAFIHALRATMEHNDVFARLRPSAAERHERLDSLYSEDDRRTLEHLAVVDMGFGEVIRQVMTHCEERGAVLNLIREALFGYLGDFLTTESDREALLARQEEQVRLSQAQFSATKEALDDARQQIASLEAEVRRLETLHRYTTAKHLRDKQRLHKKHQQVGQTSPFKRRSTAGDDHHPIDDGSDTQGAFGKSSDSSSVVFSDSAGEEDSDSDEGGNSLAALIKMKRMQEPKARRESMARPIIVPSQFSQVRDRPRVRAAEKVDAEAQTEHVVLYRRDPAPPPPPSSDEVPGRAGLNSTGASPVVAPRRRDRTASVLLVKRDVSHSYSQTDTIPSLGPLIWGADNPSAAPHDASLHRRSSIVFTAAALQARGSVSDPRRRMEQLANRAKRKETWANMEVQATVPVRHMGVQQGGDRGTERGTQTSVLLQMHLGGAMQHTPLGPHQARSLSPSVGGADAHSGTRSPAPDSTSASSVGASSFLVKAGAEHLHGVPLGSSSSSRQNEQGNLVAVEDVTFAYQALVPRSDSSTQTTAQDAPLDTNQPSSGAHSRASPGAPTSQAHAAGRTGPAATKRLAALVQPLQSVDLLSVASAFSPGLHVSPTTSAARSPQSTAFGSATPLPPPPKLRNLKWLATTAMEVHFVAMRERFSTSTDATTLLSKAFRAKYGMEKIADGYVADLTFSLKVWLGTAIPADSGGGATTPNLQAQQPSADAAFMGTYRLARSDGTEWAARLHRRLYALIQFLGLQRSVDVPVDAQFHAKAYMFYLYFLDSVRSRAPKPLLKELNDEICTRLPPRLALQTVEVALANRLSVEFLELFLLGVQGTMLHIQQTIDRHGSVSREDLEMYFPSSHSACQAGSPRVIPALELLSDAHGPRRVPGSFVILPPEHSWDLDTLLEVLVLAYDKHVHTLIRESHRLALSSNPTGDWDEGFESHP